MTIKSSIAANLFKGLAIVFISAFSLNSFADHHGDAEKKTPMATEMHAEEIMEVTEETAVAESDEMTEETAGAKSDELKATMEEAKTEMTEEVEAATPE